MKLKFVYRFLPVFIFYVKMERTETFDATTFFNLIFIRKKYNENVPLLEHEIQHVRQFYRTCGLHFFLYMLDDEYRLYSEIEAIKVQLKYMTGTYNITVIANYIFENYGIKNIITKEQIEELLLK